jgi:hypothetical protein
LTWPPVRDEGLTSFGENNPADRIGLQIPQLIGRGIEEGGGEVLLVCESGTGKAEMCCKRYRTTGPDAHQKKKNKKKKRNKVPEIQVRSDRVSLVSIKVSLQPRQRLKRYSCLSSLDSRPSPVVIRSFRFQRANEVSLLAEVLPAAVAILVGVGSEELGSAIA